MLYNTSQFSDKKRLTQKHYKISLLRHGFVITVSLNVFTDSKGSNFYILFAITVAGVVSFGGPKRSTRISSIVHIILFISFRLFRILNSVRLEPSSKQYYNYLTPFRHMSLI